MAVKINLNAFTIIFIETQQYISIVNILSFNYCFHNRMDYIFTRSGCPALVEELSP